MCLNLKNHISIQSDLNREKGGWTFFCHKLKGDLNMEIYRACKDRAYIHKRKKKIQSMYPQIFSVPKREQINH